MAQPGWSSLPADLVTHVTGCLLATNDLDYYADLRVVCHHWRFATADPRSNQQQGPRFRPTRWVMLDEHEFSSPSSDGATTATACVFSNATTGRFVRKSLSPPLLRGDYTFVTTTTGGLIVLAARASPHVVRVLNPLTGSSIHFAAPLPNTGVPVQARFTALLVGSSPTLVLASVLTNKVYWADPKSESFSVQKHADCPAIRLPLIASGAGIHLAVDHIFDQLPSWDWEHYHRCYVMEAAAGGDMLAVLKRHHGVDVFKIDSAGNVIDRVRSIGTHALFLGIRCLIVDADRFPTIEPNCVYFQLIDDEAGLDFLDPDIGTEEEGRPKWVSAAMDDPRRGLRPFTRAGTWPMLFLATRSTTFWHDTKYGTAR